jgi:hypothetical protein
VVILQVDKEEKRFLVDTAAGGADPLWNETTILYASDISIGEGAQPED